MKKFAPDLDIGRISWVVMRLFALIILTVAYWLLVIRMWGIHSPARSIALVIVFWLFASALVLAARRWSANVWITTGLLTLLGLFLPASTILEIFPGSDVTLFLIPSIALIVAALLLYSGHNLYIEWQNTGAVEIAGVVEAGGLKARRIHAGKLVVVLLLGTLLLTKALHSVYWLTVWDNTTDSLGYIWLVFPIFAAIFSGFILSIILTGRMKLLGLGYSLLISALMIAVSARAQRVDFRQLTEARAERVSQAIESYYSREGRYPQNLRQLVPRYALSLPGPVIIFGQGWCYDGANDYYRLGYVYRQHWSDPRLIGRIYKTEGEMPELHPMCEQEVAAIQERDPHYPYSYWKEEGE